MFNIFFSFKIDVFTTLERHLSLKKIYEKYKLYEAIKLRMRINELSLKSNNKYEMLMIVLKHTETHGLTIKHMRLFNEL